eukprot:CAMPEP_0197626854 /NCGR_PEP_ID=MMETSP1338-20131121/5638_1 /TAXON_ID=43686 ORGANISM="Pelagodinium beii, Strain RCC1491" /NCGR_SAMPLE_ID=MMETSP1338 /ASSEMBLY_ACC=CAM_ASM_000754 /LENGTH=647 /DNA_ID=CAMNT_0043197431 /DNA_START=59 /DNA_END=1999 /DNA_ORIENTATION=-
MTGGPPVSAGGGSRDGATARRGRMDRQRTLAGLVSTPEPPVPFDRKMPPPSPPQNAPPTHAPVAARLAIAAAAAAASDGSFGGGSLEAGGIASPNHPIGNSSSIELAWRVVHAAEQRKATTIDRALAVRVRRAVPASNALNNSFDKQKGPSATMSASLREALDRAERSETGDQVQNRPQLRSTLPASLTGLGAVIPVSNTAASKNLPLVQVSSWMSGSEGLTTAYGESPPGDHSPLSPIIAERSLGSAVGSSSKRRSNARARPPEEEFQSTVDDGFTVSGIRLDAQKRGAAIAAAAAVAPAVEEELRKPSDGGSTVASLPQNGADPSELAQALAAALGQLQQSSEDEDQEHEIALVSPISQELQLSQEASLGGYPAEVMVHRSGSTSRLPSGIAADGFQPQPSDPSSPSSGSGKAARVPPEPTSPTSLPSPVPPGGRAGKGDGNSKGSKRASLAEETLAPPGSAPSPQQRRGTATSQRLGAAAHGAAAMRRSRSMPAEQQGKAEKAEKSEKLEKRNSFCASAGDGAASAKASAPASCGEKLPASAQAKVSSVEASTSEKIRKSLKPAPGPGLPKSNAAAAAGAGSVAAKVRKKSGLPKKMVLPSHMALTTLDIGTWKALRAAAALNSHLLSRRNDPIPASFLTIPQP